MRSVFGPWGGLVGGPGGGEGTGARPATKDEHAPMGLELEVVRLPGALEGLEARGARQRACNRM